MATITKINPDDLAKAMCIAAGRNPSELHNGFDPMWRLFWTEAVRASSVYNELFAGKPMKEPS